MPNFEELKRNASGVADRAVKKTNELTAFVKLKMGIKASEAKLSSVYEEIGRLFYTAERNGEDCTSDIAAYIMKADKLKADIAAAKKQISKLKKERVCESCGNEIDENVAFCPFCGTKQEKLVEVEPETDETTLEDIVEDVEDKAEDFADKVENFAEDAADAVKDAAETVADKAEDIVEDIKDAVDGDNE
ncbi:MAG: zinc-ribbon domain-containing protein [Clostridia bacterium]|nr:zinc-ribbon domain-containing protein [Clostridia bacterium]